MIEVYGHENNLSIQFRKAGSIGVSMNVILPDGMPLTDNIVNPWKTADVLNTLTDGGYDANKVRIMLNEKVNYHIPVKE